MKIFDWSKKNFFVSRFFFISLSSFVSLGKNVTTDESIVGPVLIQLRGSGAIPNVGALERFPMRIQESPLPEMYGTDGPANPDCLLQTVPHHRPNPSAELVKQQPRGTRLTVGFAARVVVPRREQQRSLPPRPVHRQRSGVPGRDGGKNFRIAHCAYPRRRRLERAIFSERCLFSAFSAEGNRTCSHGLMNNSSGIVVGLKWSDDET